MKNRLVFDISYFAHWQGNLTGIPRMINELAIRYEASGSCTFVCWDNTAGKFYEADFGMVSQYRGKQIEKIFIRKKSKNILTHILWFFVRVTRRLAVYRIRGMGRVSHLLAKMYFRGFKEANFQNNDIFFIPMGEWASSQYTERLLKFSRDGGRLVQVIHDMLPLVTPQYSGHSTKIMERYCSLVLPASTLVLAVSQSTKRDINEWLSQNKLPVPHIDVFRHGEDFAFGEASIRSNKQFMESGLKGEDFLLCVGTIEARKNHTLLYYVYKLARKRGYSLPKLVIVGRKGWRTEDILDIIDKDPETSDQILVMKDTSDAELAWLYDNCLFSVYPSFYEGWGMPIAESIAHGSPCISSNTSSMPEIAEDLITYFDPASSDECLAAIRNLLQPGQLKAAKEKIKKFKPTTWDETFNKVDGYIKELPA